jgi:hypothetical protein
MNRHLVRAAAVNVLTRDDRLYRVQVALIWPGDEIEDESIYLLPSQGTLDVPTFRGAPSESSPLKYEDRFTIPIEIRAAKAGQSDAEADARIEELAGICVSVFAADPSLGLGSPPNDAGLMWATVGNYDGPGPARSESGAQAYAQLTLNCLTRS